jgi:hypothetical protein
MQGSHEGLALELQKRIQNDPYTRTYQINVSIIDDSEIVLKGNVRSFHHKQMAQVAMQEEIKSRCNGTAHLFSLKNEIEVD